MVFELAATGSTSPSATGKNCRCLGDMRAKHTGKEQIISGGEMKCSDKLGARTEKERVGIKLGLQ